MHTLRVKMPESGPLSVPEDLLRAAGAKPGDEIELQVVSGGTAAHQYKEKLLDIQARIRLALGGHAASVDQFIAERRADAANE